MSDYRYDRPRRRTLREVLAAIAARIAGRRPR